MARRKTIAISFTGFRNDTDDMWVLTDLLSAKLTHTPFLACVAVDGGLEVRVIDRAAGVAELPEDTPVMVQWRGQWRSDFFSTTAGEVKRRLATKEEDREAYYRAKYPNSARQA